MLITAGAIGGVTSHKMQEIYPTSSERTAAGTAEINLHCGEYGEYKKLLYVEGTYQEQRIYYGLTDDKGKAVKCPN